MRQYSPDIVFDRENLDAEDQSEFSPWTSLSGTSKIEKIMEDSFVI